MVAQRYSLIARVLHWVLAILILTQLALGTAADRAGKPAAEYLLDQHVRIGLLILALTLLRLIWRFAHPPPPLAAAISVWQRRFANAVHWTFYLLLIVLPISGYVLWAWIGRPLDWLGFAIPILFEGADDERWRSVSGYIHEYAGYVLMALLVAHIAAALWHEFVRRDRLISQRML